MQLQVAVVSANQFLASLSCAELGTAQPQLVCRYFLCHLSYCQQFFCYPGYHGYQFYAALIVGWMKCKNKACLSRLPPKWELAIHQLGLFTKQAVVGGGSLAELQLGINWHRVVEGGWVNEMLKLSQLGLGMGLAELGNIYLLQRAYPSVFVAVAKPSIRSWIEEMVDDGYCAR